MKMMENSFSYKGYTIYSKKDVTHWRAYSNFNLEINGKTHPIKINEIANTESEAIERAKSEVDRQLKALDPD